MRNGCDGSEEILVFLIKVYYSGFLCIGRVIEHASSVLCCVVPWIALGHAHRTSVQC